MIQKLRKENFIILKQRQIQLRGQNKRMNFKKDCVYYFDEMIGTFHYSYGHPMKPLRVAMTNEIVRKYKLDNHFTTIDYEFAQLYNLHARQQTLTRFHSDEYVDLLKNVTPQNKSNYEDQLYRFNFKDDCPVMERLYDYCISYATGSVSCASILAEGKAKYAFNWSGGLHHAKQSEASGFCYVNDCVLAILELLKTFQRVLYIDIDIHHGDGVEEAFYLTDRVMTCSFHKFKDYFPGTGHIEDVGKEEGTYHAVNFPLDEGMDDEAFISVTRPVLAKIMEKFRPDAVLLQGGTDSLSGDRLGCFNLSVKGHASVAEFMKTFGVPVLMTGGGGYTLRNVSRCWTYETAVITGVEIPDQIPDSDYKIYFAPEYKIHMPVSNMENQNSKNYLNKTLTQILKNLDSVTPSTVQMNVNGSQPIKINVTETMREKRDLWENANIDKNTDKAE